MKPSSGGSAFNKKGCGGDQSLSQKSHSDKKSKSSGSGPKPESEKKPLTPFFLFMMTTKDNIKAQHSEAKKTHELAKITGELWRNLSEEDKEHWRLQALKRA